MAVVRHRHTSGDLYGDEKFAQLTYVDTATVAWDFSTANTVKANLAGAGAGGGFTLAETYAVGSSADHQTPLLTDAKGGPVIFDSTTGTFTGNYQAHLIGSSASGLLFRLRNDTPATADAGFITALWGVDDASNESSYLSLGSRAKGAAVAERVRVGWSNASAATALMAGTALSMGAQINGSAYDAIDVPAHTITWTGTTANPTGHVAGVYVATVTIANAEASAGRLGTAYGLSVSTPTVSGVIDVTALFGAQIGWSADMGDATTTSTYRGIDVPSHTITLVGADAPVTASPGFAGIRVGTITQSGVGILMDYAAGIYVEAAPVTASAIVKGSYALWVDAGTSRLDGTLQLGSDSAIDDVTGVLTFENATSAFHTSFQAGVATATLTYTLPTAGPAVSGYALTSTDAGVMSWTALTGGTVTGSGTSPQIAYWDGASSLTGDSKVVIDTTYHGIAIGDAGTTSGYFFSIDESAEAASIRIRTGKTAVTAPSLIDFYRSRGTIASPTALSVNDVIGWLMFYGHTDAFYETASIRVTADSGWGATGADAPGKLEFYITRDGAGAAEVVYQLTTRGQGSNFTTTTTGAVVGVDSFQLNLVSGSTTAGFGAGRQVYLQQGASAGVLAQYMNTVWDDISASYRSKLVIGLANAGATADVLTISPLSNVWTQGAATSGSPIGWLLTPGEHTTLAASVEAPDVWIGINPPGTIGGARDVQFATGALATQRAFYIESSTYTFVGASTLSDASTFAADAPLAGTNATITRRHAGWLRSVATAGVQNVLRLDALWVSPGGGDPPTGFAPGDGVALYMRAANAINGLTDIARIAGVWVDPTSGSEDSSVVLYTVAAGAALVEGARLTNGTWRLGVASTLTGAISFMSSAAAHATTFTVGTPTAAVIYTLPTTAPAVSGYALVCTAAGVMSWAAAGSSSPLTTKGDIYTFTTVDARLAVGTDTYVLSADSTAATGLAWVPAPVSDGVTMYVLSLSSDHSNATTTATEVTGLSKTLTAGTYTFKYTLIVRSDTTTTGIAFGVNYTGTATTFHVASRYVSDYGGVGAGEINDTTGVVFSSSTTTESTSTPNLTSITTFDNINTSCIMFIEGVMVVSDGGDLELWHGSEAATTTKVMAGSSVVITKIP